MRLAAHNNAFDSNRFHKRFDARLPENNRKLIPLIMGITGGGERIRFPAEDLARLMQMTAYLFENKHKNYFSSVFFLNPAPGVAFGGRSLSRGQGRAAMPLTLR